MNGSEYGQILADQKDRVHTYAVWLLQDAEDARDVTQEALTRLWEQRDAVHNGASKTWLLRTTHRLCIDRLRRRKRRSEIALDALTWSPAECSPGPERLAAAAELGHLIGQALTTLSVRDRAVVLLREVSGMSYEEMSTVLGLPLGTLKATLHRARERLRRQLVSAGVQP